MTLLALRQMWWSRRALSQQHQAAQQVLRPADPLPLRGVAACTKDEFVTWLRSVRKEFEISTSQQDPPVFTKAVPTSKSDGHTNHAIWTHVVFPVGPQLAAPSVFPPPYSTHYSSNTRVASRSYRGIVRSLSVHYRNVLHMFPGPSRAQS